jgi:DNA-binding GntR family transcriptional regulator
VFGEKFEERLKSLSAVHRVLAEMCSNAFYEIWVNSLINITQEIVLNTFQEIYMPIHGTDQHDQIVEMVIKGNPDGAAKAMKNHLLRFADAFVALDKKYREKISIDPQVFKNFTGDV